MNASVSIPVRSGEFEGPLDLLLELVRRNEVALESVSIAEITKQYLAYLKDAERARIDLGADFIYMAATLIQIKSRMLLPQDPALVSRRSLDADDTAESLLARLREHAQAKAAAEMLKTKLEVEETVWTRSGMTREFGAFEDSAAGQRQPTLADLIDTLGEALRRVRNHTVVAVEHDTITTQERMEWLRAEVDAKARPLRMTELFRQQPSNVARCCLFLGMLELGRDGQLCIEQTEPFGEVTVARC